MAVTLAINGFGRIGRAACKVALTNDDVELVAINDLGDVENLAYLLRYDTVYGRYSQEIEVRDGSLVIGGHEVKVLQEPEPDKLPWGDMGIDVVIESTGIFTEEEKARAHLDAGAKKVIISAPTKSENLSTVVMGVNDDDLQGKDIVSNASCTTNCATPTLSVLHNIFGVEKAMLTTIHAYTATQSLVDGPNKKLRKGRAAGQNMVPSTTGAAIATTKVVHELDGLFDGVSVRVPVAVGSLADITAVLKKDATVEEVNDAYRAAVDNPIYGGVISVTDEPLVSSDFIGDPSSATIDLDMTRVVGGNLVKIMAWYDNEWGYSNRLVEQVVAIAGV